MQRRRRLRTLLAAALAAVASRAPAAAPQEPAFRLEPRAAEPAPAVAAAPFAWPVAFDTAQAAAKGDGAPLLVYFTATWCGPCKRMERTAFVDAEVQRRLAALHAVRLDIDDAATAALQRRYGGDGVPTFAVVTPDGELTHRWTGASDLATFLAELDRGEQLARTPPEPASPDEVLWLRCVRARERGDWQQLRAHAVDYLASGNGAHADDARIARDAAEFERTGRTTPELQQAIDACIDQFARFPPSAAIGARIERLLDRDGSASGDAESNGSDDAWRGHNDAAHARLSQIGRAAAPALHRAMRTRPTAAWDCARHLARLRLPDTTTALRADLADPTLPAWARRYVIHCMAAHKDRQCLPVLLERAGPGHLLAERTEAMWGVRELLFQEPATAPGAATAALALALDEHHGQLLQPTLQAAFYVQAPLPLDALDDLLDDRHAAFADFTIGDNALWILLQQLGARLLDAAGSDVNRASPTAVAWLHRWYGDHRERLVWSPELRSYTGWR